MIIVDNKRIVVLKNLIPRNSRIAEIGVAKGNFSRQLHKQLRPLHMTLIDPWEFQNRPDYIVDGTNVSDDEGDRRYNQISSYFSDNDIVGQTDVSIVRGYSQDEVSRFEDGFFDLVYVDAMHTYEAVKQDLFDYARTVRDGGIIAGHDFTNSLVAKRKKFGVIEAVDEFLAKSGYALLCVTNENYPSYFIYKGSNTDEQFEIYKQSIHRSLSVIAEFHLQHFDRLQHKVKLEEGKISGAWFSVDV